MAKNITFEADGRDYKSEFNEDAIRILDKKFDFSVENIQKTQLSDVPDLFFVSLHMHQPALKKKESDSIYKRIGDKESLLTVLVEMYIDAVQAILEDPAEGEAISWTMNEA